MEAFHIQSIHYRNVHKVALKRARLIPPFHPGAKWQFTSRRGRLAAESPYCPLWPEPFWSVCLAAVHASVASRTGRSSRSAGWGGSFVRGCEEESGCVSYADVPAWRIMTFQLFAWEKKLCDGHRCFIFINADTAVKVWSLHVFSHM